MSDDLRPILTGPEVLRAHRAELHAERARLATEIADHRQQASRAEERLRFIDAAIAADDRALAQMAVGAVAERQRQEQAEADTPAAKSAKRASKAADK